jgi:hypothetical protein
MGYGAGNSHSVGDLQVLDHQGQPVILWQQIANPQNINSTDTSRNEDHAR